MTTLTTLHPSTPFPMGLETILLVFGVIAVIAIVVAAKARKGS